MLKLLHAEYKGYQPCFCVSTNTGSYETNGFVHHNSTLVQNVLLHCIEHRNEVSLALIDCKIVETERYKGVNGVVGVANTIKEACELLRIARCVMYKRNRELAKCGVKNVAEYKPKQKTDKVYITGADYQEDEVIQVRENNEEKSMKAGEISDYLHSKKELIDIEICLNGKDWITVNKNCVNYYYTDSFPILVIFVDEFNDLTGVSGVKSAEGKEEDAMRAEIVNHCISIAQVGRATGIHLILASQRAGATTFPTVLRDNLAGRIYAGKASEALSSRIALDSDIATQVDNTYPGMAIFQTNGLGNEIFLRVYHSMPEDLDDYFSARGLDKLGYRKGQTTNEIEEDLGGMEEILDTKEDKVFSFDDNTVKFEQRQNQDWNEVK